MDYLAMNDDDVDRDARDAREAGDAIDTADERDTDDDRSFDEEDEDLYEEEECDEFVSHENAPVVWRQFNVHGVDIEISNHGYMRQSCDYMESLKSITQGQDETGSPYRVFTVHTGCGFSHSYYAHELVWTAFNGPIPAGSVVRHKSHVRVDDGNRYSNHICNLEMYKRYVAPIHFLS